MVLITDDVLVLPPVRTTIAWVMFGVFFALLYVCPGTDSLLRGTYVCDSRFYGILICQGYYYFRTYSKDPIDQKVTVCDGGLD